MSVIEQRWNCPTCGRGIVVYASEMDAHCCVIACQLRHAKAHKAAAAVLGRLGLPEPVKGSQRRKKAA